METQIPTTQETDGREYVSPGIKKQTGQQGLLFQKKFLKSDHVIQHTTLYEMDMIGMDTALILKMAENASPKTTGRADIT